MTTANDDLGVIQVLLDRLNNIRLPHALELQAKVDKGETLNDFDINFLEQVFADADSARHLINRHPELQPLASKLVALYQEITEKALANEQRKGGKV